MTPKSLIAPARLARGSVLATQSDRRLVDLVRAGHEPAFEAIVKRYRGALSRYVERFLPRERAEDAVQQAFVNAYEAMLRDDSELQLRPWLYRIAHNTALNGLRDRSLRHTELPDGLDGVERPDEALERAQGLRQVVAAVQALPERQRDAIVLRELEGRSYDEIATELKVSDGSVRQLLHRARSTLRAAATAVTPTGLLTRMPWAAPTEPVAVRVAELCGVGAGSAVVAKVCATALITGAVAGGVAVAPSGDGGDRAVGPDKAAASGDTQRGSSGDSTGAEEDGFAGGDERSGQGGEWSGPGDSGGRDDRSGPGGEDRSGSGGGDRSGSGGGDLEETSSDDDSSGPGSGGSEPEEDNSGPGSGDSGSGSGSSGSGSSGSGSSGSGSGSSGSGSDGSGSGSSGSGSGSSGSGSGSSGSGSSGSGSSGSSDSGSSGSGSDGSGSGSSGSGSDSSGSVTELDSSGSGSSGSGSDSELDD